MNQTDRSPLAPAAALGRTAHRATLVGLMLLCVGHLALAQPQGLIEATASGCGDLANPYGPFDYRRERNGALRIVEGEHFTTEVENLLRGKSGSLGSELDYTLRASPNHHRALVALSKYAIREKTNQPHGTRWTVDCYFDRGMRFAPDDALVPMLYANHLKQVGNSKDAKRVLAHAGRLAADNPLTHYNVGLMYLELEDWDKALEHALKAREYGNPRTELLDKLKTSGRMAEAPAPTAATETPAATGR